MPERVDPDQDRMDRLLRQVMATPEPRLSPSFDRTLSRRLRPHRLSPGGRWALVLYGLVSLVLSVWLMRRESIDWIYVAAAVLMPVASVGVFFLRSAVRSVRLSSG
jgi:hypothetical protein